MDSWRHLPASGEAGEIEALLRRYNGDRRWFLFRVEPVRDKHGDILKWYGANTDIEDRKRAEALLAAGFPGVYIFRPAYIYPVEPRREPNFSYRLLRAVYPVFRGLFLNQVIHADDLGRGHGGYRYQRRGITKPCFREP